MKFIKTFESYNIDDILDKMNILGGYDKLNDHDKLILNKLSSDKKEDDFVNTILYAIAEINSLNYSLVYKVIACTNYSITIEIIEGEEYSDKYDLDSVIKIDIDEEELNVLKNNGVVYFEINDNFFLTLSIDEDTIMDILENL